MSIQVCKVAVEQLPGAPETSTISLLPYSIDQSMTLARLDSQGRSRDSLSGGQKQQSPVTRSTEAEQRDLPPQQSLAEQGNVPCSLLSSDVAPLLRDTCAEELEGKADPETPVMGALIPEPLPGPQTLVTVTGTGKV